MTDELHYASEELLWQKNSTNNLKRSGVQYSNASCRIIFFNMQRFITFLFKSNTSRMENFFFIIELDSQVLLRSRLMSLHVDAYSNTVTGVFLHFLNVMPQ